MGKMKKVTQEDCRKCKYSMQTSLKGIERINGTSIRRICMYIVITNKRRGCPVGMCDKFEPRSKKSS